VKKICLPIKAAFDKYYLPPAVVRSLNARRSFEGTLELQSCYFLKSGSDFFLL
jgi:hypothetical protein